MNLGFSPIVLSKSLIQNTEFSHLMVRSTIELNAEWNKKWKCFVVKEVTDDSECKNSTWHERPIKIVQCITQWKNNTDKPKSYSSLATMYWVTEAEGRHINFIPGSYRRQKQTQPRPAELHLHWSQEVGHFNSWYICLCVQASSYTCIDQSSVCVLIKRYTRIIDCLFSIDINLCEIIHFLWLHGDYWVY